MTWHCPECSTPHDHDTVEPTLCEACKVRAELRVERAKRQLLHSRLAWFEGTDLAKAYQELLCVRGELEGAREISDGLRAELEDAQAGQLDVPDTLEDERYRDANPSGRDLYRSGSSPCCGAVLVYAHGEHPFCNECEQGYHNDTGEPLPRFVRPAVTPELVEEIRAELRETGAALKRARKRNDLDLTPKEHAEVEREVAALKAWLRTDEGAEAVRAASERSAKAAARRAREQEPSYGAPVVRKRSTPRDEEVRRLREQRDFWRGAYEAYRDAPPIDWQQRYADQGLVEFYGADEAREKLDELSADGWPRIAAFVTSMQPMEEE